MLSWVRKEVIFDESVLIGKKKAAAKKFKSNCVSFGLENWPKIEFKAFLSIF